MDSEAGKIFVGGLHWNTTDEGLQAYFEQFGQVIECHIMRDPTGKSRCFGFVNFSDSSVVDVVLQKTHILDKKQIDPKRAVPKHQQQAQQHAIPVSRTQAPSGLNSRDDLKIFVGGIHAAADEAELTEFFNQFGEVVETVLMKDRETNRSRGFGFITFSSQEAVQKAYANRFLELRGRKMEIKLAVPKGKQIPGAQSTQTPQAMDPSNYAAMAEYYRNYQLAAMTSGSAASNSAQASAYSDPKAYYDALLAAYTSAYGPEVAAQAAAYYSQYLNPSMSSSATSTSTNALTSPQPDNLQNEDDKHNRQQDRSVEDGRRRSSSTSSSKSRGDSKTRSRSRSKSKSKSPRRDYRYSREKSPPPETRGHRRHRSKSRSRSPVPRDDARSRYERGPHARSSRH